MNDKPRLIEHAFPLEQASLDSVHEKNVRHGHISTLHIWPARRPLAACRAALIATLLPDPGTPEKRKELVEKIGGTVKEKVEKKKMPNGRVVERVKRYTEGGILHWGRETENDETLQWFRDEIRKAYGGRAPKVLDPFAGGGAIPLEAMRLGCEVTAIDINPVAWFILKCTLEYPQKLAGQTRPLPDFVRKDPEFMEAFLKSKGHKGDSLKKHLHKLGLREDDDRAPNLKGMEPEEVEIDIEADLAWHVRAWGKWVLNHARKDVAQYYPTYADFEPLKPGGKKYKPRERQLVPLTDDGIPDVDSLNAEFDEAYLNDPKMPRWVPKPSVAYLWARTVTCKNCRATVPLLKTRWLCKKDRKRILLSVEPNKDRTGVAFAIEKDVPIKGGNAAQRREHDKRISAGTMTRSGATCPCCSAILTMEDIRMEGQAGRLGSTMTSVAVETSAGKEYRLPVSHEIQMAQGAANSIDSLFSNVPYGVPAEPTPAGGGSGAGRAFSVQGYGIMTWSQMFTCRQLLTLGSLVKWVYAIKPVLVHQKYSSEWIEALQAYSGCVISRTADYMAQLCVWENGAQEVKHLFMRWALPITWDFAEANPFAPIERFFAGGINSAWRVLSNLNKCSWADTLPPVILNRSAIIGGDGTYDMVFTDPPYYDAIPYSDLMDFFYVWLRRIVQNMNAEYAEAFKNALSPKWNTETNDGELIDDSSRHDGDSTVSKHIYEDGMYRAFSAASRRLTPNGHMIVVFANKKPDAWETLAAAVIRAGFCVKGSWPIVTEMPGGLRNLGRASLASSVWLICRKRIASTRPGWDNQVLDDMRQNIATHLREFWDAGIRGPDFVWAATGPALEAYSKYPAVKKANEPGKLMEVSEFLRHVRRIVVDFVVGRVLSPGTESTEASGLDDVTTYYLLHRHDFGVEDAPAGPCILYAVSCGLSDSSLADQYDILARTGGTATTEPDEEEEGEDNTLPTELTEGTGSTLRLKQWHQRKNANMGYDPSVDSPRARADAAQLEMFEPEQKEPARRRMIPLIDQAHRLMHLWKAGDMVKVDDYLEIRALARRGTFLKLLQALIELSPQGSDERSLLEKISNHIAARGGTDQMVFNTETTDGSE